MSKRTPKGQDRTGPKREDSKPLGRNKGTDPKPIEKLEVPSEDQSPASRTRSASSGAESMSDLDAERIGFEEPVRLDSLREIGSSDEEA